MPAEPSEADQQFLSALTSIQDNINNAVTIDASALSDTTTSAADKEARSSENWAIVRDDITELANATSAAELTAIIGGEVVQISQPTAGPTPSPTPVPYTTLSRGDKSNEVIALQQRLTELGYLDDTIDGNFGGNTQTAVKLFQSAVGMEETGIADPAMQAALFADGRALSPQRPAHPDAYRRADAHRAARRRNGRGDRGRRERAGLTFSNRTRGGAFPSRVFSRYAWEVEKMHTPIVALDLRF